MNFSQLLAFFLIKYIKLNNISKFLSFQYFLCHQGARIACMFKEDVKTDHL